MARQESIQRKITMALVGAIIVVLLISIFTFVAYDLSAFRSELLRNLDMSSAMLADNSTASLQFDNRGDALDVLDSVRFDPQIVAACVYDKTGKLFAQYPTNAVMPEHPKAERLRTTLKTAELTRPVMLAGSQIGTLYLKADLEVLYRRFQRYGLVALLIVIGSLAAALLFSRRMEKSVSRPILSLANSARAVSLKGDYSVRAQKVSEDEVGLLTDAFNLMLTRIEEQTAELEEGRTRLSSIIGSAMDAVISVDQQQRITIFNSAAEKMFRCSAADAIGQPLEKFIPDRFRESHRHHIEKFGNTGVTSRAMGRLQPVSGLRADGEEFPIEASISQSEIGGQKIYTVILRDITERKKAEGARALLAAVVESSEDAIVSKDINGIIISWNKGAEKLYGYPPAEAVGHPITMIIPPELLDEERSILNRVRHGEAVEHLETTRIRKDGRHVEVSLTVSPIHDSKGNVIGASKTARDITEAKRIERALRENESRKTAILESALDAVITMDQRGLIVEFNPAAERLFGYKRRDVVGQAVADMIIPERLRASHRKGMQHYIETGEGPVLNKRIEMPALRSDGTEFLSELAISATRLEGGQLFFTAYLRDITEQKRSEEEIRRLNAELGTRASELETRVHERTAELVAANKELEAFTYSVAHDLRAPLRHINAFAKILQEDFAAKLPEEVREYLSRIRGSSQNLSRLVDDLLNLARVGRQELTHQLADVGNIVQQARAELQSDVKNRDIEWHIEKNLPKVSCDPGLIKLVFVNLLSNAIKYTRPKPKAVIEIGCSRQESVPVFFVRDNGVGFNMQYANKLFGVFQRLHRQEEFEGTGVGLATVDRIIRKHGGRIWAESEVGKGATFFFTLTPADKSPLQKSFKEDAGRSVEPMFR